MAGDEYSAPMRRVDLPQAVFEDMIEAIREGIASAERRHAELKAVHDRMKEPPKLSMAEQTMGVKPPQCGVLDGLQLAADDVWALVIRARQRVDAYKVALENLNP